MKKAFTLTELLVVIVILAVLASFLFPVIGSSKSSAQKTSCISNIHQLYVAMQMYRDDNGGYPQGPDPNVLNATYLGGVKLRCPSQTSPVTVADYFLNGHSPGVFVSGEERKRLDTEYSACQEKRGQDFPLVWDSNHMSERAASQGLDRFWLCARESGQIERIPGVRLDQLLSHETPSICAIELGYDNL